jgi:hypothetical protein
MTITTAFRATFINQRPIAAKDHDGTQETATGDPEFKALEIKINWLTTCSSFVPGRPRLMRFSCSVFFAFFVIFCGNFNEY